MTGQDSVKHLAWKRLKNGRKTSENVFTASLLRLYFVFTSSLLHVYLFLAPVRHLELSTHKGTKKVRETLDMVGGVCNRIHQNTTNKITNY